MRSDRKKDSEDQSTLEIPGLSQPAFLGLRERPEVLKEAHVARGLGGFRERLSDMWDSMKKSILHGFPGIGRDSVFSCSTRYCKILQDRRQ